MGLTEKKKKKKQLLLNAAIATKYPGKFKLAGVWEFVERKSPTLPHTMPLH